MTACSPRIHVDSRSSKLWGRGKPGLDKCFSPPCCDSPGNGVQTGWWTHGKRQELCMYTFSSCEILLFSRLRLRHELRHQNLRHCYDTVMTINHTLSPYSPLCSP